MYKINIIPKVHWFQYANMQKGENFATIDCSQHHLRCAANLKFIALRQQRTIAPIVNIPQAHLPPFPSLQFTQGVRYQTKRNLSTLYQKVQVLLLIVPNKLTYRSNKSIETPTLHKSQLNSSNYVLHRPISQTSTLKLPSCNLYKLKSNL